MIRPYTYLPIKIYNNDNDMLNATITNLNTCRKYTGRDYFIIMKLNLT